MYSGLAPESAHLPLVPFCQLVSEIEIGTHLLFPT